MQASADIRRNRRYSALSLRALFVAAAVLAAGGSLLAANPIPGVAPLTLVPAAVMALAVLSGWRVAAAGAALIAAFALIADVDGRWQVIALAAVSVVCGEGLRRGIRPLHVVLVQIVMYLASAMPARPGALPGTDPQQLAAAALQGCGSVAVAVLLLLLLPRRGALLATRCRTRWDHFVFCLVVGTSALTAVLLVAGLAAVPAVTAATAWRSMSPWLLAGLAGSLLLNQWLSARALRTMPALNGRLMPAELASYLAAMVRERLRMRRSLGRDARLQAEARQQADLSRREAATLREALSRKSSHLDAAGTANRDLRCRLQAVIDSAGDVLVFANDKGVIEAAGGPCTALLGYTAAALQGQHLGLLVPVEHMLDHPLDLGSRRQVEQATPAQACEVQKADGSRQELSATVHPFDAADGRHYAIRLHAAERLRSAMATLEQARELTRSANQSRDLFVATMSHELRTPLHGLIATLDMLRGEEMSADLQHHLAIARTSARALLKIANDVLDLSRLGSDLFPLERRQFSLKSVLREVMEELEARATSFGLAISVDVVYTLPPSFWGDPARLKQILANLVSNALKFTARGGVTLHVGYSAGICTIDVEDTGDGIPFDKRESIFDPFIQLKTRSAQRVGGTGLGLPISRRIAEAAGGKLVLLRSSPQGSTFRLTLPLEASEDEAPDEQSQRVFANPHGRILVVEDNPANRYVAQALLASLDCPATIVESGRQALELLRDQEFDLILMDCQMPGMDGYETTRRARRMLKRHVPIVAMTANAMAEDRNECLAAGMDDFFPKPFGRQGLSELLGKWLDPGNRKNPQFARLDANIGLLPDLEEKVLDELWESLRWQREPLQRICASFAQSLESIVGALEDGAQTDRKALLRQLHAVLGSSGMVGARQIEYLTGRIQAAVKEDRAVELKAAAEMLRRAMFRYEREFARKLDGRQAIEEWAGETPATGSGAS